MVCITKKSVGAELVCPVCGCPEVDPETGLLNIRGYKVGWWSECLNEDHGVLVFPDGSEIGVSGTLWFVVVDDETATIEVAQGRHYKIYINNPE